MATKQQEAIRYISENYLQFNRIRHDVVSDKLQIRLLGEEGKGERQEYWREMTKQDINSIVCQCAQECDSNITSREVMTVLQSDLVPSVHPLREYIQSCRTWTKEQPDWIDFVARQVRVKTNDNTNNFCARPTLALAEDIICLLFVPLSNVGEAE